MTTEVFMKTLTKALTGTFAFALLAATSGIAEAHHYRGHYPRYGYDRGYGDGFFAGLVASTAAIMLSHTLFGHYKQLVMMGADEDAALFLATGEQPSAMLTEAMKIERAVLAEAGIDARLTDEDVAYLIIERAAQ
jgi:hypothetical protein